LFEDGLIGMLCLRFRWNKRRISGWEWTPTASGITLRDEELPRVAQFGFVPLATRRVMIGFVER